MLVSLAENLMKAEEGHYAVGAFNAPTLETVRAVVEAAEELKAPIILSHAEAHNDIVPIEIMGPILVRFAQQASVPITVHLDHGMSLQMVQKAIGIGFSSVMIDASYQNFTDNIRTVKEVVEYAHQRGVSVEAELGTILTSSVSGEESVDEKMVDPDDAVSYYTDPDLAKVFVEETNIDALAASFGTVHGLYFKKPNLDFQRLASIYQNTKTPIVMHGGSGLSEREYITAIGAGVRKINYYSYAAKKGAEAVKDYCNNNQDYFYHDLTLVAKEVMKKDIKKAIAIFLNK